MRDWANYEKLFVDKPNIRRIIELLRIRNSLQVSRCLKLFGPRTIAEANSALRRAGHEVRLCATPETVHLPLNEQVIHLYVIKYEDVHK